MVEAGAGDGRLTEAIAARAGQVIAVEIDPGEHQKLVNSTGGLSNVQPVLGDFLHLRLPRQPYHVVANLPFSLTADTIRLLVFGERAPVSAHLVVEREAALRWLGWEGQSAIGVLAQVNFAFAIALALRRTDFDPNPARAPVLLAMHQRQRSLIDRTEQRAFGDFVRRAFAGGGRLGPNLRRLAGRDAAALRTIAIDFDQPPSALTVEEWVGVFEAMVRPGQRGRTAARRGRHGGRLA